jgi:hypothetical protein
MPVVKARTETQTNAVLNLLIVFPHSLERNADSIVAAARAWQTVVARGTVGALHGASAAVYGSA